MICTRRKGHPKPEIVNTSAQTLDKITFLTIGMLMKRPTRDELRELLVAWRDGSKTTQEVHEVVEEMMAESEWSEIPRTDPRSIEYEVLCQLDILNQQLITPEDVEAFLAFLSTPNGAEKRAWVQWEAYWEQLDWDARRRSLSGDPYYAV